MELKCENMMQQNPVLHADIFSGLKKGWLKAVCDCETGCLLYDEKENVYYLTAADEAAYSLLEPLIDPGCHMIVTHQEFYLDRLSKKFHKIPHEICHQVVRFDRTPIENTKDDETELAPVPKTMFDRVFEMYGHGDREYVKSCFEKWGFLGAFIGGELAGFIGVHSRGSMGFLHVDPKFRRRGLAHLLESTLANHMIEHGDVPFAHIIVGNDASMCLQKKMGLVPSDDLVSFLYE